ncbi:MAG: GNAT family N-acetyltransferase [Planctomycetales bacterium]|nr:GNAT family N-acetyltransferase [Planctomycetales bacterium]
MVSTVRSSQRRSPVSNGSCSTIPSESRNDALEVEEFFVRPQFRRSGIGEQLADMLMELANELRLPIRFWIADADAHPENLPALMAILAKLRLKLCKTDVRWASAMAR